MTVRQIFKKITRNRRVKKAIQKIKTDHEKQRSTKSKKFLDDEFNRKYNIVNR